MKICQGKKASNDLFAEELYGFRTKCINTVRACFKLETRSHCIETSRHCAALAENQ